ncbi:DUF7668 domain-containing protein [Hymenobacter frigidus]|uniref:DUF7668 domain-containing protein n=1 Tax=Hymenobacter frigidus TaxID=1524095 RepID=UPI00166E22D5|nr:hypothetical protein [Hymenobacter frigidus]
MERIVRLLAQRDFVQLTALDREKQLTAEDMAEALDGYYGGAVTFPEPGIATYDFYPVDGTERVAVDYDLLIDDKESWLTLQCQFFDDETDEFYPFTLESIHAL